MASIINGLFSGRSGISSHGIAIAVIGDNISNANTVGYKRSRTEFEDIIAGGQTAGKTVGSGSAISKVSNISEQGTMESTGRSLDLALDGNGFFAVDDNGTNYYTRAGNFTIDSSGYVVDQKGNRVLGFPQGGSGSLEALNITSVSQTQSNIQTQNIDVAGNLDASQATGLVASIPAVDQDGTATSTTTYADLNGEAEFSTVIDVFDSLGASHTVTVFFFHIENDVGTGQSTWAARAYVNSEDVDPTVTTTGLPRLIGETNNMQFTSSGGADTTNGVFSFTADNIQWNNGSSQTQDIDFDLSNFTQYATSSNITSLTGDGDGVGSITSLSIDRAGQIFALLNNGQSTIIGQVGLVNFANPEGLVRVGSNLLQQSTESGAPIVGRPDSGTFGSVESGSIELSTVDIASEFVKLITLQRGFQANSRIITTINQLLNEIIQLA